MNIKNKLDYFSASLYIGSKEGYHGKSFSKDDLIKNINYYQDNNLAHPVKITSCTYTFTSKYLEDGWEINAITYPNSEHSSEEVWKFMEGLGKFLLEKLKQNRITLRSESLRKTIMFEKKDPEYLKCKLE